MKILTGELRGREIAFRPNPHLRPTADKVRKAIFDALGDAVRGAKVLDLFSGTGALGLEALSGGAAYAVFVESDKRQVIKLAQNLKNLGLDKKARVIHADAIKAIERAYLEGEIFDLIFLDPPYCEGWERKVAEAVRRCPIISKKSWVVMESASKDLASPERFGPLVKLKEKAYGDTRVVFYGFKMS